MASIIIVLLEHTTSIEGKAHVKSKNKNMLERISELSLQPLTCRFILSKTHNFLLKIHLASITTYLLLGIMMEAISSTLFLVMGTPQNQTQLRTSSRNKFNQMGKP